MQASVCKLHHLAMCLILQSTIRTSVIAAKRRHSKPRGLFVGLDLGEPRSCHALLVAFSRSAATKALTPATDTIEGANATPSNGFLLLADRESSIADHESTYRTIHSSHRQQMKILKTVSRVEKARHKDSRPISPKNKLFQSGILTQAKLSIIVIRA